MLKKEVPKKVVPKASVPKPLILDTDYGAFIDDGKITLTYELKLNCQWILNISLLLDFYQCLPWGCWSTLVIFWIFVMS